MRRGYVRPRRATEPVCAAEQAIWGYWAASGARLRAPAGPSHDAPGNQISAPWARIRHSYPHRAASGCTQPHTRDDRQNGPWPHTRAGQGPFSLIGAEGVGFEPTMRLAPHSGFQDRRHRPLGEPSADNDSAVTAGVTQPSRRPWPGQARPGAGPPDRSRLGPEILGLTAAGLGEQPEQHHDQRRRQEGDHPGEPELVTGARHRAEDDQAGHGSQHARRR
jgi:hypothetical protein